MNSDKTCNEFRSNEIIMENLIEMSISQEGRDRIGYTNIAIEAFGNPTKQANILNKLFKEVQKVEEIDFGKIPDSKGDLTKYVYYDQMYQCIEVLNELVEDHPTPNITSMNKLHQILLNARQDFTFGYRTDNFVIISTYNLMVTSLYEMINVCTVDATEYLRAKMSMQLTTPTAKQMRWVTKTANQFIKMYESGQWATIMKTFKSAGGGYSIASEASSGENDSVSRADLVKGLTEVPGKLANAFSGIKTGFGSIPMVGVGKVAIAFIGLFMILRAAIYYGINAAGKLSDRLKNAASILRANAASESAPTAVEKQKKMLNHLENISDTIDYKIMKSEKSAEKDMKNANKAEFSPQEINNISGSDFEFDF